MTEQHRRVPGRLARAVLTAGALLGTLCLVAALAGTLMGATVLIFQSGSMGPERPAGSLGVTRPVAAADLRTGDIVSVRASDDTRVTHRIVAIERVEGDALLTLRGDANPTDDAETYRVAEADRLILSVPWLGYVVGFLGSRWGLLLLGVLAGGLLVYAFRPTRDSVRPRVAAAVAAPAIAVVLLAQAASGTAAAWTDTAAVRAGTLAAHTVVSQAQPTCVNVDGLLVLGNIARIRWTHVDPRYEYYWELRNIAGTALSNGTVGGGQSAGSTVTLDVSTGLIGTNGNYNVVVRARMRDSTSWVAGSATTTPVRRGSILVIGLAMRCGHA